MGPRKYGYWHRFGGWLLVLLLLSPLVLLASAEAVYRYGMARVGKPPKPPTSQLDFPTRVLWLVTEQGPLELEPLSAWGIVKAFNPWQRLEERRPAGFRVASLVAKHEWSARPGSETQSALRRSLHEFALTIWISRNWSAEELLNAYARQAWFGQGARGLTVAAGRYFSKRPEDLAFHETALLAALPQAPQRHDPFCQPEQARVARDVVLSHLQDRGWISATQAQEARARAVLSAGAKATLPCE